MKLGLQKQNMYILFLGLIYIFGQNVLYLLPVSTKYNWTAYILIILMGFAVICVLNKGRIPNAKFTFLMAAPIFLALMAAMVECLYFGDANIVKSMYKQMQWWIYPIIYYIVYILLLRKRVTVERVIKLFICIGLIQVCIGILQYLVCDTVIFTYAPTTKRLGSIRFYFPVVLMVFVFFWAVNIFLGKNKKQKIFSIVVMALTLFEVTIVQQFRSTLIGMVVAAIIGILIWRKASYRKIIVCIGIVIVAIVVYLNSQFLQNSVEYMLSNDTSLNVRQYLIDFILENAQKRIPFGSGWVSSEAAYLYASTPYRENINWGVFAFADGGIFSILYSYGLFGVAWVALLWWRMLSCGWKLIKAENNYVYFLFPLYMFITMYIDIHWYIHDQFFVLALFCAILEYKMKNINKIPKRSYVE